MTQRQRCDWLWLGLRGLALYFLARTILLIPDAIQVTRTQETLYGNMADQVPPLLFGVSGIITCMVVYAMAAVALLLVPVRERSAA